MFTFLLFGGAWCLMEALGGTHLDAVNRKLDDMEKLYQSEQGKDGCGNP